VQPRVVRHLSQTKGDSDFFIRHRRVVRRDCGIELPLGAFEGGVVAFQAALQFGEHLESPDRRMKA